MKKVLILLIFTNIIINVAHAQQAQKGADEEPFTYEVNGLVYVYHYDTKLKKQEPDYFKIAREPLKFTIESDVPASGNIPEFVIIKFVPITSDMLNQVSLTGNDQFVNSEDNDEYFYLNKSDFDSAIKNKTILTRYVAPHVNVDYGASVSLPFKYRPSTSGQNSKITPDVALGGYTGLKWRLSHYSPYYVTFPLATVGLSTISINNNSVTPTTITSTTNTDGLILGVTGSTGIIFQLKDFQFGFIIGWDRATGEVGKDWIYNNKAWYSLSIGYSFLGKADPSKAQK